MEEADGIDTEPGKEEWGKKGGGIMAPSAPGRGQRRGEE